MARHASKNLIKVHLLDKTPTGDVVNELPLHHPMKRPQTAKGRTQFKKLDIVKGKLFEPRIEVADFMDIKFKNEGVPDIAYLYVYLVFGDNILEYFIRYILKLPDLKMYFTTSSKFGLSYKVNK